MPLLFKAKTLNYYIKKFYSQSFIFRVHWKASISFRIHSTVNMIWQLNTLLKPLFPGKIVLAYCEHPGRNVRSQKSTGFILSRSQDVAFATWNETRPFTNFSYEVLISEVTGCSVCCPRSSGLFHLCLSVSTKKSKKYKQI